MPSWNVHLAHAERLLDEVGASALGVRDENAFLVGNVVPDIPVGFIVKDPVLKLRYTFTHLAEKQPIPFPRADEFWDTYIEGRREVDDVTLGAWAHLAADRVYNLRTRAYLDSIHKEANDEARTGKQGDFALFGRTLRIERCVHVDENLLRLTAAFEQYALPEEDVREAVRLCCGYVDENHREHLDALPELALLTPDFFEAAWREAHERILTGLVGRIHKERAEAGGSIPLPSAFDGGR